jgi:hypothetical protein
MSASCPNIDLRGVPPLHARMQTCPVPVLCSHLGACFRHTLAQFGLRARAGELRACALWLLRIESRLVRGARSIGLGWWLRPCMGYCSGSMSVEAKRGGMCQGNGDAGWCSCTCLGALPRLPSITTPAAERRTACMQGEAHIWTEIITLPAVFRPRKTALLRIGNGPPSPYIVFGMSVVPLSL